MGKKLLNAGLEPVFETYIFEFLPLPVFLFRTLSYRLGLVGKNIAGKEDKSDKEVKSDHSQKQGLLGAMMASSFDSELQRIQARKPFGFGGSCLVAARK